MSGPQIFAFVLMPFDPKFDDIYKLGIQDTAAKLGIRAERLDEQIFAEGMMERLFDQIDEADIIIADMSNRNPNVFYEVGFAHARDKLCILITSDASDIPFDLKHRRHAVYGSSLSVLRERLTKDLEWAIGQLGIVHPSYFRADYRLKPGRITAKEYSLEGRVDFIVDIHNDLGKPATEIHAAYLYVIDDTWKFVQAGRACGSTLSDLPTYTSRHLLSCPVVRLPQNGWTQFQFSGTLVVASRWGGPPPQRLSIAESALLRLVTDRGNVDLELDVATSFTLSGARPG